jgi:phosphoribosyl 1,2-cyclic phosphate phosphodiesterase
MRFVFLGTGTSAGVPAIACDCAVCRSADPRDRRLRTSAAVQFTDAGGQDRTVLIDTSPDLREQALRARMTRLDAVLYTHNHVDHTFGLDEVRRFNAVMRTPIDVFAEDHTLAFLRRVYAHIFDAHANVNESFVATLIANRIDPERVLELFGVRFEPIRFLHGRLPILGFRIEAGTKLESGVPWSQPGATMIPTPSTLSPKAATRPPASSGDAESPFPLAYCTDVSGVPPESWRKLEGLSTLVLDALRHRHHPTHLTLDRAVEIAERVGARQTWFVHMSHDLAHAQTDASLPEGMALAYDGLTLGL